VKKFHLPEFDYEVEIGKFARQANGAVWLQKGGTVVLSTVVSSPSREFPGFLPLTSEYREQFSAAGKIPGGYYKREGKPSDKEVLTSRLIDRAIRPLFPVNFFDQLQVITTVYSVDKEHAPHNLGLLASSLAISLSNIPFAGPIGVVEVGRIDGEWVINPSYPQSKRSDVRLIVAGTYEGLCMVEGSSNGIEEKEFVDLLFKAHEEIKKLVKWQQEIVAQVGAPKEPVSDPYHWDTWQDAISRFITSDMVQKLYIPDKVERNTYIAELKERFITGHQRTLEEQEIPAKVIDYIFDLVLKQKITDLIFQPRTH
jgi:polyribonucleotide nucleotidyltransferase